MIAFVIFVKKSMEEDTKAQLKKIQQQFSVVNAKISYLQEGVGGLKTSLEQMGQDFNLFIDLYSRDMEKIQERFERIEKHVGL